MLVWQTRSDAKINDCCLLSLVERVQSKACFGNTLWMTFSFIQQSLECVIVTWKCCLIRSLWLCWVDSCLSFYSWSSIRFHSLVHTSVNNALRGENLLTGPELSRQHILIRLLAYISKIRKSVKSGSGFRAWLKKSVPEPQKSVICDHHCVSKSLKLLPEIMRSPPSVLYDVRIYIIEI